MSRLLRVPALTRLGPLRPADVSSANAARPKRRALRPRDAASLIIFDIDCAGQTRVLAGRRRMDQVFLPGHYVFPGGRVDRQDTAVALGSSLASGHSLNLGMSVKVSSSRARAIAAAAVRETFEETGLIVGRPAESNAVFSPGSLSQWQAFLDTGFAPALSDLAYLARAITPPGRPRRYDTRFFAVSRSHVHGDLSAGDGELEDLDWRPIADLRRLELPAITRLILEDFVSWIAAGQGVPDGVPFYFHRRGRFERVLMSLQSGAP